MLSQLIQSQLNLSTNVPLQVHRNSLPREPQAEQRLLSSVVGQNLSQAALALKVLVSKEADNEKFNAGRQETALKGYRSGHRTQNSSSGTSGSSLPCPARSGGPGGIAGRWKWIILSLQSINTLTRNNMPSFTDTFCPYHTSCKLSIPFPRPWLLRRKRFLDDPLWGGTQRMHL